MSKRENQIIKEVLSEKQQELIDEIQDKERVLTEVLKKYFRATMLKDFKEFINDKDHRDIEIPYELIDERDKIEREIRKLKNNLSNFNHFKEQTEKQLKD